MRLFNIPVSFSRFGKMSKRGFVKTGKPSFVEVLAMAKARKRAVDIEAFEKMKSKRQSLIKRWR